jgi:hypothetical protein
MNWKQIKTRTLLDRGVQWRAVWDRCLDSRQVVKLGVREEDVLVVDAADLNVEARVDEVLELREVLGVEDPAQRVVVCMIE